MVATHPVARQRSANTPAALAGEMATLLGELRKIHDTENGAVHMLSCAVQWFDVRCCAALRSKRLGMFRCAGVSPHQFAQAPARWALVLPQPPATSGGRGGQVSEPFSGMPRLAHQTCSLCAH